MTLCRPHWLLLQAGKGGVYTESMERFHDEEDHSRDKFQRRQCPPLLDNSDDGGHETVKVGATPLAKFVTRAVKLFKVSGVHVNELVPCSRTLKAYLVLLRVTSSGRSRSARSAGPWATRWRSPKG